MNKVFDIIMVGNRRAIISEIYKDGDVEVVYEDSGKHINEDAIWEEDRWKFKTDSVSGGYADNYQRLQDAIRALGK